MLTNKIRSCDSHILVIASTKGPDDEALSVTQQHTPTLLTCVDVGKPDNRPRSNILGRMASRFVFQMEHSASAFEFFLERFRSSWNRGQDHKTRQKLSKLFKPHPLSSPQTPYGSFPKIGDPNIVP